MNLINTTVFKMALRFAAAFALLAIGALSSVYYITLVEMESQIDRELVHELEELKAYYQREDLHELVELIDERDQYGRHLRHYYALTDMHKKRITGNSFLIEKFLSVEHNNTGITFFKSAIPITDDDHKYELRGAIRTLPNRSLLIVAQAPNSITELKEHTFSAVIVAVIITIFLSLVSGAYMGRMVMIRINRIDKGLIKAIDSNFRHKLPVPKENDEFQALTLKLNVMLEKIESLINSMKQVTDNVAHDLRSPLSRLRSRLEVTLLQSRDETEYREAMSQAIEDCDSLLKTFNALLNIAQAESGAGQKVWQRVDLSTLVDQLVELYQPVAEDKGLNLQWERPEPIEVDGNKVSLSQAVSNLLENAIKYTPENGKISLSVSVDNAHPVIHISDNGPGIPFKDRKRVLERFQRLDSARSSEGNGLGLSLVNAVVKSHQATLILGDNNPGLKVEIRF